MNREPIEILMIEDNLSDIVLVREALNEGKVRKKIHAVCDGVQAMDFLYRQGDFAEAPRPDLILLDLNIPRKNGWEVLVEIKADPELCSIPVVVLSTSQEEEDISKSYSSHANCFITKPVTFDGFLEVMRGLEDFWFKLVSLPPRK